MKNTREIATEYRMAQWTEVMRERQSSGLSIIGYCRREGIKADRYFYWQRKLRKAAINLASPNLELLPPTAETIAPVPAGWTQVTKESNERSSLSIPIENSNISNESIVDKSITSSEVTIDIGKCRVTVNDAMNTELLSKVCKVLVELC